MCRNGFQLVHRECPGAPASDGELVRRCPRRGRHAGCRCGPVDGQVLVGRLVRAARGQHGERGQRSHDLADGGRDDSADSCGHDAEDTATAQATGARTTVGEPGGEPLADRGQLRRDVHQQCTEEQPSRREVHGDEVPRPRVVLQDVEDAGDQLQQRRGDQQADGGTLGAVHERAHGRPLAQPVLHRPELGQQQRDRGDAGDDVQALRDAIAPQAGRVVTDQPGREADEHRDADREAEPCRERSPAGRTGVGGRPPRRGLVRQAGERRRHASMVLPPRSI